MQPGEQSELSRLRLVARALIEWRTPRSSEEYRQVLADLIAQNPLARLGKLSIDHPIVHRDVHASLLWYLSETLVSARTPTKTCLSRS